MLRKIRVTLAVVCFTLITLLFLDFTGTLHAWFGWLAKIQFLPAVLALNVGVIVALLALTLLSGRVYCSVICPLGVFQDAISWISGKRKKKKYRFSYSPAVSWLRSPAPTACATTSRPSRPRRLSGNSENWLPDSHFDAAEYCLVLFRHRRKVKPSAK